MPELADVAHPVAPVLAPSPTFPPPWPGMPVGFEALSAAERMSLGGRFGVDTPYYAAPTGFGEWIPLVAWDGVNPPPRDVRVLSRLRRYVPSDTGPLYPHHGLYPHHNFYPRHA